MCEANWAPPKLGFAASAMTAVALVNAGVEAIDGDLGKMVVEEIDIREESQEWLIRNVLRAKTGKKSRLWIVGMSRVARFGELVTCRPGERWKGEEAREGRGKTRQEWFIQRAKGVTKSKKSGKDIRSIDEPARKILNVGCREIPRVTAEIEVVCL